MRNIYVMLTLQALLALAYSITPLSSLPYLSFDVLVLLYVFWVMYYEDYVGLGGAWVLGILKDVLSGTLLGEHALALSVVAYLMFKLSKRMKFFSFWQQALDVGALVFVNQLMIALLEGFQGHFAPFSALFYPSLMSILLWLVMAYLLFKNELRDSFTPVKRFNTIL